MGWKYNLAEWFIDQENRYNTAAARIGMVLGLIASYAILDMWVKDKFGIIIPTKFMIPTFIIYVLVLWFIGYGLDKWGWFIICAEWGNKRDALKIAMREKFNFPDPKKKRFK